MRRQGASPDAGPSSFFVSSPMQQGSMDGSKTKKSWGERLKLGKQRDERDASTTPDNLMQEYRNKYGTLSSGSALSKSMKYAETWLYGSVAIRQPSNGTTPRPSLFLYHPTPPAPVAVIPTSQVILPPGNYAVVMCSCPEFLTGTAKGKKNSSAVCKKCGGSRVLWTGTIKNRNGTNRGVPSTVGGTLRLGGGGQYRVRPSLPSPNPAQNPKPSTQPSMKETTPDPYALMRKNRLGGVKDDSSAQFGDQYVRSSTLRERARSTSPCRRRRSPSPPITRAVLENTKTERGRASKRDLEWETEYSSWDLASFSPDTSKRKSILECDVTAYELIAKYLKNGNRTVGSECRKVEECNRKSSNSDDDLLDDDMSDCLSDNALENNCSASKGPRKLSQKSRTLLQSNAKDKEEYSLHYSNKTQISGEDSSAAASRNNSVTLGGKVIKLFNEQTPKQADHALPETNLYYNDAATQNVDTSTVNENASSDKNVVKIKSKNTYPPSSMIPRLSSPRRPPRKIKSTETNTVVKVDEIESGKLRIDNSDTLECIKDARLDGACVIKSILKKPFVSSPADTESCKTFSDTVSKPDLSAAGNVSLVSSQPASSEAASSNFYLPTFQEFRKQHRKKKQVQFKVSDDVEEDITSDNSVDVNESSVINSDCNKSLVNDRVVNEINDVKVLSFKFLTENGKLTDVAEESDIRESDVKSKTDSEIKYSGERESDDFPTSGCAEEVKGADNGSYNLPDVHPVLGRTSIPVTGERDALTDRSPSLRRSQSERLLFGSGSLRGNSVAQEQTQSSSVVFNDTMRLRLRPGRPDIRQVFSDPGAPGTYTCNDDSHKRNERLISPARQRPKEPPPPPPPPPLSTSFILDCMHNLPELPPRHIFPFTKKQIEQMNNQARQFSLKSSEKQKRIASASLSKVGKSSIDLDLPEESNIRPVSWSPLKEKNNFVRKGNQKGDPGVIKKKEHRHSDPGPISPKLVVHIKNSREINDVDKDICENDTLILQNETEMKEGRNSLPKMSKYAEKEERKLCTIVKLSTSMPGTPLADVHRLQIKSDEPVVTVIPKPQRKTSILINSEDSLETHRILENSIATSVTVGEERIKTSPLRVDCTNKVTINVGGDNYFPSDEMNCSKFSSGFQDQNSLCRIIETTPNLNLNKNINIRNSSSLTILSSNETGQVNIIPITAENGSILVLDHYENLSSGFKPNNSSVLNLENNVKIVNNTATIIDHLLAKDAGHINQLTSKTRGIDVKINEESDVNILMNPVEAVKRNLIPHVCGKKSRIEEEENKATPLLDSALLSVSPTERLNKLIELHEELEESERETMKEGDYCIAAPESKLLDNDDCDDGPIYSNILTLRDDTLLTVQEEDIGDDEVFKDEAENRVVELEPNFEECSNLCLNNEVSVCDMETPSLDLEGERTEGRIEEDDELFTCEIPNSLEDSEKSEKNDEECEMILSKFQNAQMVNENIYEIIKDPIYEEIPDTPPPLPLSPPPSLEDLEDRKRGSRSIFEGASKYDILSYLVGAKERGIVPEENYYIGSSNGDDVIEIIDEKPIQDEEDNSNHQKITSLDLGDLSCRVSHLSNASDSSEDSCNLIGEPPSSPNKVRKSSAEIERNDSGVGSETSKSSRSRWQHGPVCTNREDQQHLCEDCDQPVETQVTNSGVMFAPLVCRKCSKKRAERKEIIAEIVETEEKYGRDLQIIMEEFYRPMLVAGLLTPEQLAAIFLNVEELLEQNAALAEKLRDNLEIAVEQGDEDLLTVNMGRLFLEAAPMLHAFESYCIRQGAASLLLANLEKEKELLRIFLRVSQMENAVLRRMNLNSFLMVPVQRVTKYPLLLARLHKVTPAHHESRDLLRQAQNKIELHLEHMNSEAKDISTTKLWRRISIMNGRRSSSETDMLNIKLRKMALDILEWNNDEVRFAMEGKLLYTNPADNNWRKGRTIKLSPINALLVTNGKPTEDYRPDLSEETFMFPRKTGVREATLLLLKEKCGRYTQLREPLYLDKCIVCCEVDWEEYFEVQELASKDTFIFKAEDADRTKLWYRQLQYLAQGMGAWRRRRNAMANIMINGMHNRN